MGAQQGAKTNENKEITIYDIAREAGVSPATVSRVLSSSANVRQEKKQRVQELIDKYQFRPNAFARGLADTKSRIIGILAADIRNPYYAELFASCEMAAAEAGYSAILCNSMNNWDNEGVLLDRLKEHRVDAVIQMGGNVDSIVSNIEYVEKVNQLMKTTPVVVTGRLDGTKCRAVRIDSMKAMELLMDHLLNLGHRHIALVGGDINVLSTYEKVTQYRQMLVSAHIPYDPEIVTLNGSYSLEHGYEEMNRLLDMKKKLTAVVAINDFTAAGVVRCLEEHGIRVPEDISVVSYDNTYIAEITFPGLTTVDYNYDEFGRRLVEAAIQAAEGVQGEALQIVSPSLVVRRSSGPAPVQPK